MRLMAGSSRTGGAVNQTGSSPGHVRCSGTGAIGYAAGGGASSSLPAGRPPSAAANWNFFLEETK